MFSSRRTVLVFSRQVVQRRVSVTSLPWKYNGFDGNPSFFFELVRLKGSKRTSHRQHGDASPTSVIRSRFVKRTHRRTIFFQVRILSVRRSHVSVKCRTRVNFHFDTTFNLSNYIPSLNLTNFRRFPNGVQLRRQVTTKRDSTTTEVTRNQPILLRSFGRLTSTSKPSLRSRNPYQTSDYAVTITHANLMIRIPPSVVRGDSNITLTNTFAAPTTRAVDHVMRSSEPPPL